MGPHFYQVALFAYAHLPEHLQLISKPFNELAKQITEQVKDSAQSYAETSKALDHLLAAKDAAVRAGI